MTTGIRRGADVHARTAAGQTPALATIGPGATPEASHCGILSSSGRSRRISTCPKEVVIARNIKHARCLVLATLATS